MKQVSEMSPTELLEYERKIGMGGARPQAPRRFEQMSPADQTAFEKSVGLRPSHQELARRRAIAARKD